MARFRDKRGRFVSAYVYSLMLRDKKVKLKDAFGKPLGISRQEFIVRAKKSQSVKKAKARDKARYERKKKEKILGIKIVKPEVEPVTEVIGPRGGVTVEQPKRGSIETYVRYGYATRRDSGSDGPSARGAVVVSGEYSLKDVLAFTKPNNFYRGWIQLGHRADILEGVLTLLSGSGIHYQLQRRDAFNNVRLVAGSEQRLDGNSMLDVGG